MSFVRLAVLSTLVFTVSAVALAQPASRADGVPALHNWPVASEALVPEGNALPSAASHFIEMAPCRVYDSRVVAGGPGPIPSATARTTQVAAGPCAGIPSTAAGFSLNFTVTGSPTSSSYAFLTAYPTGTTRPNAATVNFKAGTQVGNAAIVPAGTGGAIDVYVSLQTEVIVDINGYFAEGVVTSVVAGTGLSGGGTGAVNLSIADGGVGVAQLSATGSTSGQVLTSNGANVQWQNAGGTTGAAGGDLSGTYPNPTVASVGGEPAISVSTAVVAANAAQAAATPDTIVRRDFEGNFAAGTITASLNGNATTATTAISATNFSGALAGEVTGSQGATVVSGAVPEDLGLTIVRRDASGDFSAGSVSLLGSLLLPTTTSSTAGTIRLGYDVFAHNYGSDNTFLGRNAGNFAMTGGQNTAVGTGALSGNTTGSYNIAIGTNAGADLTSGDLNIDIGHSGFPGEASTIRIGTTQNRAFVAGINGVTTAGSAVPVLIDANGQLGTASATGTTEPAGGDLSGFYPNPTVATVGGQSAANVATGVALANAATQTNTPGTIVRRDPSGNFAAGVVTAALNGNATTATAATTAILFSGALAGEVTGTQWATVVSNAVSTNTADAVVRRNASGNFSAGTVTLSGNLGIPVTGSSSAGVITIGGNPFAHVYGQSNTFLGVNAGNFTMNGVSNTATGYQAMYANSSGSSNVGNGFQALHDNTTGSYNMADGFSALGSNTTGTNNTAAGNYALYWNTTGCCNIAVGMNAGYNVSTGNYNIDIGSMGGIGDSETIRIGTSAQQSRAFIAGISGVVPAGGGILPVVIDSSGQLGTANSIGASGPAGGDLTGTYPNPTVASVGGQSAANLASGAVRANAATSSNTPSTIVMRDGSGGLSAGTVILSNNLGLPATASSAAGVLFLGGNRFMHGYGMKNTFLGTTAGNFSMTGSSNTAIGNQTLSSNTTGIGNTATGDLALNMNTTGGANTAYGDSTLDNNVGGNSNTASGYYSLHSNTSGSYNTAAGDHALTGNTTGNNNIAVGFQAGGNLSTGNYNIDIGNLGVFAESSTIRLGDANQTRAFIAGIRGVTTAAGAVPVLIDGAGQLGTTSSSRRYKFDIIDMDHATEDLMRLRPVTFRYLAHGDNAPLQYGLIAEEVAEVYPELVAVDNEGQPETVMYQFLAPMLLNEVQKDHRVMEQQQKTIDMLLHRIEALEERLR